jgi:hypothetical protein
LLFAAANEPKQGEFIPDVGHNDVYTLRVQEIILSFLGKIPTDPLLEQDPMNRKPDINTEDK